MAVYIARPMVWMIRAGKMLLSMVKTYDQYVTANQLTVNFLIVTASAGPERELISAQY